MGLFGPTCGGCGRGVPRGNQFCPRCARAGGIKRNGQVKPAEPRAAVKPAAKRPKVAPCGRRLASGATCHRSLTGNESCSNH